MAKVKVAKNKGVVTSKGDFFDGQVVDLPADEAAFLIAAGKAEEYKKEEKEDKK